MGRAWDVLMKRLGYIRYVVQGGDWGRASSRAMGRLAPAGLIALQTNFPATVLDDAGAALGGGSQACEASPLTVHSISISRSSSCTSHSNTSAPSVVVPA
jgi:hypothetical protein